MGIRHQLLQAGIHEDDLPSSWLPAIIAAMEKWLITTPDGLKYVAGLFNFDIKPGEEDKNYLLIDNVNYTTIPLKTSQVWFFEGALVDGIPIPLMDGEKVHPLPQLELEISESAKNKCDNCGIFSHCTKEILDPITDKLLTLCNFCITHDGHPRIKENGNWQQCVECRKHTCGNHPRLKKMG